MGCSALSRSTHFPPGALSFYELKEGWVHTLVRLVLLFIQKISNFLTSLPSLSSVSGYKQMFFLTDTPQKVDKILRPFEWYILRDLAFLPFSYLGIQLFRLRIAMMNAIRKKKTAPGKEVDRWYIIIDTIESMAYQKRRNILNK